MSRRYFKPGDSSRTKRYFDPEDETLIGRFLDAWADAQAARPGSPSYVRAAERSQRNWKLMNESQRAEAVRRMKKA